MDILILPKIAFVVAIIWMILRGIVFLNEVSGNVLPLGIYPIVAWVARMLLMLVAVCAFLFFLFLMSPIGGKASTKHGASWFMPLSLMLYVSAAFVMSLPFFPLKWHVKAFYPVQVLLWPIPVFLFFSFQFFLVWLIGLALFFLLWFISLSDRLKVEGINDSFKPEVFSNEDFQQPKRNDLVAKFFDLFDPNITDPLPPSPPKPPEKRADGDVYLNPTPNDRNLESADKE